MIPPVIKSPKNTRRSTSMRTSRNQHKQWIHILDTYNPPNSPKCKVILLMLNYNVFMASLQMSVLHWQKLVSSQGIIPLQVQMVGSDATASQLILLTISDLLLPLLWAWLMAWLWCIKNVREAMCEQICKTTVNHMLWHINATWDSFDMSVHMSCFYLVSFMLMHIKHKYAPSTRMHCTSKEPESGEMRLCCICADMQGYRASLLTNKQFGESSSISSGIQLPIVEKSCRSQISLTGKTAQEGQSSVN